MTYPVAVMADGPALWWRLNETSGTTANDSSGNGRHGTYVGSPTLGVPGLIAGGDTAVTFDGVDDRVTYSGTVLAGGPQSTIEFWIKATTPPTERVPFEVTGVSCDERLRLYQTGLADAVVNPTGSGTAVVNTAGLSNGARHHVVITWDDATDTETLYVDNVLIGTGTESGQIGITAVSLGARVVGSAFFPGTLDEFAIYATALSPARVAVHYAAGIDTSNVTGGTAHEGEQGHAGSYGADIDVVGGTAEEGEQGHAGTATTGILVVGGTAQEQEHGNTGVTTQASGTANNYSLQRVRGGRGVPMWEPDVVPAPIPDPPPGVVVPTPVHINDVVAAKWDGYGITNTQLTLTDRVEVRRPGYRYRIVVAGHDLTYWRGHVTPAPKMTLVEPLLYGPATLDFPQVQTPYEQPGHGALTWMVPGADVKIQLVDADNVVAITVWVGKLLSPKITGAGLSWSMMGQATGPAALQDKQLPLAKRKNDLGFWWWGAINQLRLPFLPRLGPDTGIKLWNSGQASLLDYMLDLAAKGWERNGTQWTCMPDPVETGGTYRVIRKDRETIHATLYLDDHMAVPDLTRDPAEEPNRMFPSSVSPGGRRIRFGVYPAMSEGAPPPFPGHMESGDTGDGVLALINRLVITSYLSLEDKPGGYDDDVVDAVRALQKKAGLSVTGEVNNATWEALYDVGITGYDIAGSRILPAVEWDSTRRYDRTPNGNIIRENPAWNPDVMVRDLTVNLGPDFTRQQDLHWARRNITDEDNPNNWVGQITINGGGVIIGEHNFGDPLDPADIQDAHVLRPGMNLWLPTWDDGTLVHISAVTLDGGPVKVDVDTRARDALQVWEVQSRNRESRQNPARAFLMNHRSSMMPKDSIIEFDENGGTIDRSKTWMHQGWNHFPVVVGQEGTIAWTRIWTGAEASDPTEFCMAVTVEEIQDEKWTALIGDPLSPAGYKRWTNEAVREALDARYVLLYAAGNDENPCGYFPSKKVLDDGEPSGDPLTGRWEDPASYGYRTSGDPVLWVSVFVKHATRIRDGRVFKDQGESGS